jgi:hypothetical protein
MVYLVWQILPTLGNSTVPAIRRCLQAFGTSRIKELGS